MQNKEDVIKNIRSLKIENNDNEGANGVSYILIFAAIAALVYLLIK